jgi:hypothetical protein
MRALSLMLLLVAAALPAGCKIDRAERKDSGTEGRVQKAERERDVYGGPVPNVSHTLWRP